jgi:uncharacterized protein
MNAQKYILSPDAVNFPVGDRTALYHRQLGGLCFLDADANGILGQFSQPTEIAASVLDSDNITRREELIQQLVLRQLLVPVDRMNADPEYAPVPQNKVNIIQLILTNACNFGCTYCFEGVQGVELPHEDVVEQYKKIDISRLNSPNEIKVNINESIYASEARIGHQYDPKNRLMKPKDAIAYVDKALEIAKSTGVTEVMLQFFGGEPLLNWKAIKAVLDTYGNGAAHGIVINYSTVTNGSLISEEVAETFARHKVAVCVSFDSPKSTSRPLKNGGDSAPVVMEGLRMLQKHQNRVAINSALTSDTWDEFDNSIVDLAHEYGAREIGVVVDFDPTFYSKFGAPAIVEKLWGVIEYGRTRGVVLTGYWHQIFQVLLGFDAVSHRGFKNCSAKGAQLSIEPNGSVFSCKAGSGLYGNVLQGPELLDTEIYRQHASLRRQNPAFCRGCEIEGFCAGLCLGPLEKKFGDVASVEPSACDMYRGITRKLIEAIAPYEIATFDLAPN